MEITQKAWEVAFEKSNQLHVEQIDRPRVETAFTNLIPTLKQWPAPAQVIELMPRRKPVESITYDPPADADKARKVFSICMKLASGEISKSEADAAVAILSN